MTVFSGGSVGSGSATAVTALCFQNRSTSANLADRPAPVIFVNAGINTSSPGSIKLRFFMFAIVDLLNVCITGFLETLIYFNVI